MITTRHRVASSVLAMSVACASITSVAAETPRAWYDIPAEPLTKALIEVGRVAGRQILFPGEQMNGMVSPALHDELSPEEALTKLLQGTPFTVESTQDAIFIRGRSQAAVTSTQGTEAAQQIVVTGSNIRGAHIASSIISLSRQDMEDRGETNLGDVARDIPQSFAGGQKPERASILRRSTKSKPRFRIND